MVPEVVSTVSAMVAYFAEAVTTYNRTLINNNPGRRSRSS